MTAKWAKLTRSILLCLLCFLSTLPPSSADVVAVPNTFVAGQTLPAAQLNQNFSVIYNEFDGNIANANVKTGAAIALSKLALTATALDLMGAGNNTWASGVTGDTVPRITMTSSGLLKWGPGGATANDLALQRSAAKTLQLNDNAGGAATLDMNGGTISNVILSTDLTAGTGMVAQTAATTYAARTITAGAGISMANGSGVAGNPTITNTGVTSNVAGTGINVSGATGAVTISLANTAVVAGTCTACDLTIDAQGRITAKANGPGSGNLTTSHTLVSSAELLDLATNKVELVAAQGAGAVIIPVKIAARLNYGTTTYAVGNGTIGYNTAAPSAPSYPMANLDAIITETQDSWFTEDSNGSGVMVSSEVENTALTLGVNGGDYTTGDGTLDVWVTYYVLP